MKFLVKRASTMNSDSAMQPFPGVFEHSYRTVTDSRPWGPIIKLGKPLSKRELDQAEVWWTKFQQEGPASNYRKTPVLVNKRPETVQVYYERDLTTLEWFWECTSLEELVKLQGLVIDQLIICMDEGRPCIIIYDDYR